MKEPKRRTLMATKQRTAAWYFREIKRQVNIAPTRPARFDFMWPKARSILLEKVLDMLISDDAPQWKIRYERWFSSQPASFKSEHLRLHTPFSVPIRSWSYSGQEHFDLLRKKQGFWRVAFFGPDYKQPAHFLDVPLRLRGRDLEARFVAVQKQVEALHRKFGADYHIEHIVSDHDMLSKRMHKYGFFMFKRDEHNVPLNVLRVWRGEDWLAKKTEMFYPAEIAYILRDTIGKAERFETAAEKLRARDQRLKSQSIPAANKKRCIARTSDGAPTRYTSTDAEIIAAVTEYKRQHPRDRLSTMLNHIRIKHEGRPYLNYSDPDKLRRRLKKIFAPKTPRQGYHALK